MRYGNRSLGKRVVASPFALVGAFILFVVLANASWNIYGKARASSARLEDVQIQLAQLRERQGELNSKVSRLSTEQGIESEIRTKFHAVKEGESVAVIIDEEPKTAAVGDASSTETAPAGWWRRLLRIIGF
jgi:cell division protein FtsB